MKSKQAQVHFNENGIPIADHFDDVYFSNDSGINETQHVFIKGNDISAGRYGISHTLLLLKPVLVLV